MFLTIDPERCTGCRICEVFCSFHHEGCIQPSRSRISVIRGDEAGQFTPSTCHQCRRALCAEACPEGAIVRNTTTQAMEVVEDRCLGCSMCLMACPFGGIAWDGNRGLPIKCDLCQGQPECVRMCPTGALRYVKEERAAIERRRAGLRRLPELLPLVEGKNVPP